MASDVAQLHRRLAAILQADVVGYSRLMGEDEAGTLARLDAHRSELIDPTIRTHHGRLVKLMGDGALVEFPSVVEAVACAVTIQKGMADRNRGVSESQLIRFRIGINLGDVIVKDDDIYGDGVNVAARLEALAEPGAVCVSDAVRSAVGNKLPFQCIFIGEHSVKHIKEPVRAYRVLEGSAAPGAPPSWQPHSRPAVIPQPTGKPSITVKPFETIGTDTEQEQLADGLTNGIVAALTRLPGVTVIGDESLSMVESKRMTIQEIGQRFQVRYILKGSVQKFGSRIRVNAELIEIATGRILWAQKLDRDFRDLGDFFAIQDEITEEIVTALDVKLLSGEAVRLVRKMFKDPDALESYFRGEDLLWRATMKLEFREVERLFEEVIRLQPESPVGYAAAALAYWVEVLSGLSATPSRTLEQAVERAREAIRLDDVTGYAHMVMAHIHLLKREYDEAMTEATRAVSDRPSCPATYALKASVLNYLGRSEDAIEFAQYATRLSPVRPPSVFPAILACAFHDSGRYEEAVGAAQAAIELGGRDIDPYVMLAACNVAWGRDDEARLMAEQVRGLNPDFSLEAFAATQPYKDQSHLTRLLDHLRHAGLR